MRLLLTGTSLAGWEGERMEKIVERLAGLDVHKSSLTACVRYPGEGGERSSENLTFGATTKQLLALRDWLKGFGVTLVAKEATGVYWKAPYYLLEDDFECWLLNAQHLHNVPGRKTDVKDAAWIAELTEHGLVRPSFVPPKPIRDLRNLTRYRRVVIEERAREVQRLHEVLEEAGIKLSSVASEVLGVSGRAMVKALIEGVRDPQALAGLARGASARRRRHSPRHWTAGSRPTTPSCARRCSAASTRLKGPSRGSRRRSGR